ncbi:MAG: hypothetical protein Q4B54_05260 [Coriobacteriales bacterium]|nr:hypothetical protein [Coriobacteriales bacterium]
MKELREVQVGTENIVGLADCIVRGGILPERESELNRSVRVHHNVVVEGGTYAENLEIDDGPCEFRNAVYVNNELHVKTSAKETIVFRKAVASADTVSAFVTSGRVLFGADINADVVRLKNCYVGGSIFGGKVELENCVVVGGAFASNRLSLANTMVGTFHAPSVSLAGVCNLLYPTAFSVEPMQVLPGAELWCLALADLGALFKGDAEKPDTGRIAMDPVSDAQRTDLVGEDGSKMLVRSYSVATRVLASDITNPEKFENHFLLSAGALGTQMLKSYTLVRENGERSAELTIENIADFLFRVSSGAVRVQELDGHVSFQELRERFG